MREQRLRGASKASGGAYRDAAQFDVPSERDRQEKFRVLAALRRSRAEVQTPIPRPEEVPAEQWRAGAGKTVRRAEEGGPPEKTTIEGKKRRARRPSSQSTGAAHCGSRLGLVQAADFREIHVLIQRPQLAAVVVLCGRGAKRGGAQETATTNYDKATKGTATHTMRRRPRTPDSSRPSPQSRRCPTFPDAHRAVVVVGARHFRIPMDRRRGVEE